MAQLPSSNRINQYTATASQTTFIYDFQIYEDDEIMVQQGSTTLTLTDDYTVTDAGEAGGGTVVLVTGATAGDIITLTGDSMVERETTFSQGGDFNASAINGEFDRIDNILSEIVSDAALNFKLPYYSETISPVLPVPSGRTALVWNTAGTALENSTYDPDTAQTEASAYADDASDYADDASDYADAAAASAVDSSGYADDASGYADAASSSADDASGYADAASDSADAAAASAASIGFDAIAEDLIPATDSSVDLGSTSKRWADGWVDDLTVTTDVDVGGDVTVTGDISAATFNSSTIPAEIQYMRVQDIKAQNTAGGTFTAGDWRTRDLITVTHDGIDDSSLASNQVTLPAGTYIIEAFCPSYDVLVHWARIYNVTASAAVSGSITAVGGGSGNLANVSISCKATFSVETTIEVQGQVSQSHNTNGMGVAGNVAGLSEYYTDLRIWRLA